MKQCWSLYILIYECNEAKYYECNEAKYYECNEAKYYKDATLDQLLQTPRS